MTPRTRCWSLLLCLGLLVSPASADADPVSARVYKVHYRSLSDAAELASQLMSNDGTLTLKPRLKTLIVEDRESVLDKVQSLLDSFDLPPRTVEVTLSLILGHRDDENGTRPALGGSALSQQVRGVVEALGDFTKWTSYEPLGSRAVTGVEGDDVVASLSGEYRVAFRVESVHERQQVVKFEYFSLQRVVKDESGASEIEDLYTAGLVVKTGKLNLVVAASAPDSQRALFLALQVTPR